MNSEITSPMPTVETLGSKETPIAPIAPIRRRPCDGPVAKQVVLEAVHALYNQGLPITRESITRASGIKLNTVDDALKALKEDKLIWAPERGVYRPVAVHPPARPISKTILPGGLVKLEIGDEVLTLTPQENRMLAELQAGAAAQVAALEGANAVLEMASMVQVMFRSNEYKRRAEQMSESTKG